MIMLIKMTLENKITEDIKKAMLNKDTLRLEVCRAIKSSILLAKTEKGIIDLKEEKELDILHKLLKQRKEAEKIYITQSRLDLAQKEKNQAKIISTYLPEPYTQLELESIIDDLMDDLAISSKKEMGKLIAAVINKVRGRADGKSISEIIKNKLV